MNWVTVVTHHTHPHWDDPKVQVDVDSIRVIGDTSFSNGCDVAVLANVKRIGLDGTERIEERKSKDWLAVALALAGQRGEG